MNKLTINKTNETPAEPYNPNEIHLVYNDGNIISAKCYITTNHNVEDETTPSLIPLYGHELLSIHEIKDEDVVGDYQIEAVDAIFTYLRVLSTQNMRIWVPLWEPDPYHVDFKIGTKILIGRSGDGEVTIECHEGVTLLSPESLTIRKKYGKVTLIKVEQNVWELEGNLLPLDQVNQT